MGLPEGAGFVSGMVHYREGGGVALRCHAREERAAVALECGDLPERLAAGHAETGQGAAGGESVYLGRP